MNYQKFGHCYLIIDNYISMESQKSIWMDGQLIPWEQASVHILNHSLHYGGAVFEGIRAYKTDNGTAIFRLKEHVDRLFDSAKIFKMEIKEMEGKGTRE